MVNLKKKIKKLEKPKRVEPRKIEVTTHFLEDSLMESEPELEVLSERESIARAH